MKLLLEWKSITGERSMNYRLISRDKFPPGGWKFYQPETDWKNPNPMTSSFTNSAKEILKHRKLNPNFPYSLDLDQIEWELENFTALRMAGNPRYVAAYDPERTPASIVQAQKRHTSGCRACP
jgi:hypothetical protein